MPDATFLRSTPARAAALLAVGLLASTAAFGLPWDIDMADSQAVKAYEREMIPIPAGTVPQANPLTPNPWAPSYTLPESKALTNPLPASPEALATGKRMYDVYCTPCHGDGQKLGPVSKQFNGIALLAGNSPAARLKAVTDGEIYVTIRHGKGLMPGYGWAMDDTEMWALVHYARTMPGAAYVPPAPPPTQENPR